MGKERLEQNLIDQMKEAQLKLGFEEAVSYTHLDVYKRQCRQTPTYLASAC